MTVLGCTPNPNIYSVTVLGFTPDPNPYSVSIIGCAPNPNLYSATDLGFTPNPNLYSATDLGFTPEPNLYSVTVLGCTPDPNLYSVTVLGFTPDPQSLLRDCPLLPVTPSLRAPAHTRPLQSAIDPIHQPLLQDISKSLNAIDYKSQLVVPLTDLTYVKQTYNQYSRT